MYNGERGLFSARMTTVVDCGTIKGNRKVFIQFQLEDYPVTPKNPELPIYRQFCKFPYGGELEISQTSTDYKTHLKPILDILGYEEGNVIDFLIDNVGAMFDLSVEPNRWNGGVNPIVAETGHRKGRPSNIDWGVELKTFRFTEDTIMKEIDSLGFDKKKVKSSVEYAEVKGKLSDEELINDLF